MELLDMLRDKHPFTPILSNFGFPVWIAAIFLGLRVEAEVLGDKSRLESTGETNG